MVPKVSRLEPGAGIAPAPRPEEIVPLLLELEAQVRDQNLAALDSFERLAELLPAGQELARLRDSLDLFDFKTALEAIAALRRGLQQIQ